MTASPLVWTLTIVAIGALLDRLIYLSFGLAAILGFIGVKLILHALHENNVPFINGGEPVDVVEISTGLSLSVIVGVLLVTLVASRRSPRGRANRSCRGCAPPGRQLPRLRLRGGRVGARRELPASRRRGEAREGAAREYRRYIPEEQKLMDLNARAHAVHDERVRQAG